MTTVMIVESEPAFLARLCNVVATGPELTLLGAAADVESARRAMRDAAPDVLVADLALADGNGVELISDVSARLASTDTVVVTDFADEEHLLAAIEAGARGYLLKDGVAEELVPAIRVVRAGGSPISPMVTRHLLRRLKFAPICAICDPSDRIDLSRRESEILLLLAKGFNFAEVARLLSVSPHTVTAHAKKIYRKLAVHSRSEAVYEAGKLGLI
jgi:DNA-binding NarL/FixJ family response regulator